MSEIHQNLNLKNLIEIHFDSLTKHVSQKEDDYTKEMIVRLKDLKNYNINFYCSNYSEMEKEFEMKWKILIEANNVDHKEKLDRIKSEFIKRDALVYFEDLENLNECQLILTDWFNSRNIIDFIRYFIIYFKYSSHKIFTGVEWNGEIRLIYVILRKITYSGVSVFVP